MKEWLITDTHFDHENIGVYCDRPEGWADKILKNWRQIVQPDDIVIHLGDVMVGRGDLGSLMATLPGTKILIRGNHDVKSPSWFARNGFAIAAEVHGHCHNSEWQPEHPFQRLLAIEHEEYRPVSFLKWVGMARSENKWKLYRKSWRTIGRIERRKDSLMIDTSRESG